MSVPPIIVTDWLRAYIKLDRNQTNLAIKGIIALEAMSRIASLTGHDFLSSNYSSIAKDYLGFWSRHGVNRASVPNHSVLQYDSASTYGEFYSPPIEPLTWLRTIADEPLQSTRPAVQPVP